MYSFNIQFKYGVFDGELCWEAHIVGTEIFEYADTLDEVALLATDSARRVMGIDEPSIQVDTTDWSNELKHSCEEIENYYRRLSAEEELDLIRLHKGEYQVDIH